MRGTEKPIGHRTLTSNGYIMIKVGTDARSHTGVGWQSEHVLVMEEALGRALFPGENIHHRNGVRNDNRLKNLELWVTMQPPGQRVEDLVEFAYEILQRQARGQHGLAPPHALHGGH